MAEKISDKLKTVKEQLSKEKEINKNNLFELPNGEPRKGNSIILPNVIGIPPTYELGNNDTEIDMNEVMQDTMMTMELIPSEQTAVAGLELYRLTPALDKFKEELNEKYKVTFPSSLHGQNSIKVAILNNSPPSETFNNEFGEAELAKGMLPQQNDMLASASFVLGADSGNIAERMGAIQKAGIGGKAAGGIGKAAGGIADSLNKAGQGSGLSALAARSALMTAALKAGRGIDFPQIWKSSSWSPSYAVNVRLYNPFPSDKEATNKYIVGPLATLLTFVVPRTNDGFTFFWPWMCRFKVKGLYDIRGGYIKSITVIKGGDDNNLAYNQRPGIVDIKIDFGVLFNTMISNRNRSTSDIPALTEWLDDFEDSKGWVNKTKDGGPSWTASEDSKPILGSERLAGSDNMSSDAATSGTAGRNVNTRISPTTKSTQDMLDDF